MQVILNIDGKDKTFQTGFVRGRIIRKACEVTQKTDFNNLTPETFDNLVGFFCEIYDSQFTIDDVYDGLAADALIKTIIGAVNGIMQGTYNKLDAFPNGPVA